MQPGGTGIVYKNNNKYVHSMKQVYFLIVILLLGCTDNTSTDYLVGKKIIYPIDSLKQYNSCKHKKSNSFNVLLCLNASCPTCIEEIYRLDAYLQQGSMEETQFVVILTGQDSEFAQSHINEINSFEFPILYDQADKFIKMNELGILKLKQSNCVLVGPDSIIKNCGSPHLNPKVARKQKNLIKKFKTDEKNNF